jgi:glycosyltransferase involved in cell wall biosynthesis
MKILQVISRLALGSGGPTKSVLELSSALTKKGQEVTVYTTNADIRGRLDVPLERPVHIQGAKVIYFPVQYPKGYHFSLPLFWALRKYIPDFDIVHIHALFEFPSLVASHYCQKYNKPYIISTHGVLDPLLLKKNFFNKMLYLNILERKNLEKARGLHVTSEEEGQWCRYLNFTTHEVTIPLGIDLNEFKELPAYGSFRAKYPELKCNRIILFLSRINFKKGLDILVKAFSHLARKREDIYLVIAGPDDDGYGNKVRKWLKEAGVLNRVIFTGMLLGKEKLAAFRDSDIFVLPSYSENFGIAVVEALASGLPVVISNKVGLHREVARESAGIVVDTNWESICKGITLLLDDSGLREKICSRAKKMAEKFYDIGIIADRMLAVYRHILDEEIKCNLAH